MINAISSLVKGQKHVITLEGYVPDISRKLDEALSLYMVCAYDQSYCWGEIPSLAKALQNAGTNVASAAGYIEEDLKSILKFKFQKADVRVEVDPLTIDSPQTKLNIDIELTDNDYKDRSVRILEISDGKFSRLIKINNGI